MIERLYNSRLLCPGDIEPSQSNLRVVGVFNPGAVECEDGVTLLVRVAEASREKRLGKVALPRWVPSAGRAVIDWLSESDIVVDDPRVVTIKATGLKRLTFISHLAVVRCGEGRSVERIEPTRFMPAEQWEEFGVEDPRITALRNRFHFTYVAVSRHGAATALASTEDFRTFTRHGIIFPPENKDVMMFPDKIEGRYLALHRPNPAQHFSPPEIWLASSPDLLCWGNHAPLLSGDGTREAGRIGAGAPPLRTTEGWLAIYHGNGPLPRGRHGVGRYSAGAVLLDRHDPRRIIGRCANVLVPQTSYERKGFVPDVVFPTGVVPRGETILVYYGAADECTGVVELRLRDVLTAVAS